MTAAHIKIEVPDYSEAYPHLQTVPTQAHLLARGDEVLVADRLTYRVITSEWRPGHDGPGWTVLASGVSLTRFRVEPNETFQRVVEHDSATCKYCLGRFKTAQATAAHIEKAKAVAEKLGIRAYNREPQGDPFFETWGQ